MTKEEIKQHCKDKQVTPLAKYIAEQLFELGSDLHNHKEYSFNRGINVGKAKAYQDILAKIKEYHPSNLDEASEEAKEIAYKTWSEGENWSDAAIKTFKAGAEWMAEQGESVEFHVYEEDGYPQCYMKLPGGLAGYYSLNQETFKNRDKVIVQIRKK